jgi:hypothetical protein
LWYDQNLYYAIIILTTETSEASILLGGYHQKSKIEINSNNCRSEGLGIFFHNSILCYARRSTASMPLWSPTIWYKLQIKTHPFLEFYAFKNVRLYARMHILHSLHWRCKIPSTCNMAKIFKICHTSWHSISIRSKTRCCEVVKAILKQNHKNCLSRLCFEMSHQVTKTRCQLSCRWRPYTRSTVGRYVFFATFKWAYNWVSPLSCLQFVFKATFQCNLLGKHEPRTLCAMPKKLFRIGPKILLGNYFVK